METATYRTVLVRWHADRMLSWVRERLPWIMQSRIDPDCNVGDSEYERGLMAGARLGGRRYDNGGGEDSSDLKRWIVGVGIVLSGAFIIGGWSLSNQMAAQTVKLDYVVDAVKAQNERITQLERQRANERR
jgi:hypothetical protein